MIFGGKGYEGEEQTDEQQDVLYLRDGQSDRTQGTLLQHGGRERDDAFSVPGGTPELSGRVHGGLIAAMHDELGLRAVWAEQGEDVMGVTMELQVQYRRPVPYAEEMCYRIEDGVEEISFCPGA